MKIRLNEDQAVVDEMRKAIVENDGYCPCAIEKTNDTICICAEFREMIADENYDGPCGCGLWYKDK